MSLNYGENGTESSMISVNKAKSIQHQPPQPWLNLSTVSDHIRCFCNYPQCVTSGYMCKSRKGGCFSTIYKNPRHHPKHGCLELLTEQGGCHNDGDNGKTHCCHHDMCNHIDNSLNKNTFNISALLGDLPQNGHHKYHHNDSSVQEPMYYTESQVWFRAATIAVPICGAMILFLLIFLAMKILRSEKYIRYANRKLDRGNSIYGHYTLSRLKSDENEDLNHYREVVNHFNSCNKCNEEVIDVKDNNKPLLVRNDANDHARGAVSNEPHQKEGYYEFPYV